MEKLKAELHSLCKRYPNYDDFDKLQTRDYILYPDALSHQDYSELERTYIDIVRFQGLMTLIYKKWKYFDTTSDNDLTYLEYYVRGIKDTKLRLELERAVNQRELWLSARPDAGFSDT